MVHWKVEIMVVAMVERKVEFTDSMVEKLVDCWVDWSVHSMAELMVTQKDPRMVAKMGVSMVVELEYSMAVRMVDQWAHSKVSLTAGPLD